MAVTENIYIFNEYVVHVLHAIYSCILAIAFVLHKKYLLEVQKFVENIRSGWVGGGAGLTNTLGLPHEKL